MLTRVWTELDYQLDVCRISQGGHIEHLWCMKKTCRVSGSVDIRIIMICCIVCLYMGWFFSLGTNASVLSCNNVGRCHFYRRLLTCIPSLGAHDLARPHHRSCAVAPVTWVVGSQRSRKTVAMFSKQEQRMWNHWDWEVLYHPPYSPDISPCDYDLIPKMPLRGKRYCTIEDVKQAAERALRSINRLGSANRIQRLLHCWEHVVHNGGDYIEGLWNLEPSRWAIYPVITLVPKLKNQPM